MKIFISHSKKDNTIVYRTLKILDDNKIPHWVDLEQIGMSSSVNKEINDALYSSSHFMLMWSKDASKSSFVKMEYNAVITPDYKDKIKMIILKIDDTKLPPLLSDRKYYHIKEKSLEEILENLVCEIKESQIIDERHERFDKYLDESFGNVSIAEHKYMTSFTLKHLDQQVYKEDMITWTDSLE